MLIAAFLVLGLLGHGGKSGRYEQLRELAFEYAFPLWQLGVEKPP